MRPLINHDKGRKMIYVYNLTLTVASNDSLMPDVKGQSYTLNPTCQESYAGWLSNPKHI